MDIMENTAKLLKDAYSRLTTLNTEIDAISETQTPELEEVLSAVEDICKQIYLAHNKLEIQRIAFVETLGEIIILLFGYPYEKVIYHVGKPGDQLIVIYKEPRAETMKRNRATPYIKDPWPKSYLNEKVGINQVNDIFWKVCEEMLKDIKDYLKTQPEVAQLNDRSKKLSLLTKKLQSITQVPK